MKNNLVQKYLVPSPATPKGRMKRLRTGVISTRGRDNNTHENKCETTKQEESKIEFVQTEVVQVIPITP